MESDSKEGKNAELGNKNSRRSMKSSELPANLKPKFPSEKEKDGEKVKDEIVIDKESEENAHHSLSPAAEPKSNFLAAPLKPVKTEEKLAKLKRSDYIPPKSSDTDKEGEEPAHHSPSEPSPLKMVKTAEKLKTESNEKPEKTPKTAEKMEKTGDKDKNPLIAGVPSKPVLSKEQKEQGLKKKTSREDAQPPDQVGDAVKPNGTGILNPKEGDGPKSYYGGTPVTTPVRAPSVNDLTNEAKSVDQKTKSVDQKTKKNAKPMEQKAKPTEQKAKPMEQKSKQPVQAQQNKAGFFKAIRMKFAAAKVAELEARANPTPEQMAKPYVPAEYAFHPTSNDFKPDPINIEKRRISIPADAHKNNQGERGGALYVFNRPFWLARNPGGVKNQHRRTKIQIHKKLKKVYEGNKNALAPQQGLRKDFLDPIRTENVESLRKKHEWRFSEKQMIANTFHATLLLENEKARLDKEPNAPHLVEKKAPERAIKFKFLDERGITVVSENPPVNVPATLYVYDRKDRPGVDLLRVKARQFTTCDARVDGRKPVKPVKKTGSSTSLTSSASNSQIDSKKT